MKERTFAMMTRIFIFAFLGLMLGWPQATQAEGPLRERIRERIAQRLQQQPAPEVTADADAPVVRAGDYVFSIPHDGLQRFYKLHVPPSYSPSRSAALLVALHGGGGDMSYMAKDEYYGLISKSDKEGFVVAFPNGYSRLSSGRLATWNAGSCCAAARDQNIDDVGFIRAAVGKIVAGMNIDRNRIFATGMSNGAMMSYRLACEAADIFKAVAPVAGTEGVSQCSPARPVSILHIHARNDDHVLFDGGAGESAFKDRTKVADFVSVPETISRWVARDQCKGSPSRVLNVKGAYCDLYESCAGGAKIQLCVTEDGGHSWPGGTKPAGRAKRPPSNAISADDIMWDFFMSLK